MTLPDGTAARHIEAAAAARLTGGIDLLFCGLSVAAYGLLLCLISPIFDALLWALTPLGCGTLVWGAQRLAGTALGSVELERRAQWGVAMTVGALAFSPFLFWWREMPKNFYFAANTLCFAHCLAWFAFNANWMLAHLTEVVCGGRGGRAATLSAWVVFVGWIVPLCAVTGFLGRLALTYEEPVGWVLRKTLGDFGTAWQRWLFLGIAAAPIAATCFALVKARRAILNAAPSNSAVQPPPRSPALNY